MTLIHNLGMFLLGIRDCMSLGWVNKLLFCFDEKGKLHPASEKIRKNLKSALIRVGLFLFIIPLILIYVLEIHIFALIFRLFFVLLIFGYIFFYN